MFAVIFEVFVKAEGKDEYLKLASELRGFLKDREGFISIERFQSMTNKGKLLSLSFWETEEAIDEWRNLLEHRNAQELGKARLFDSYRIQVAQVVRDYANSSS